MWIYHYQFSRKIRIIHEWSLAMDLDHYPPLALPLSSAHASAAHPTNIHQSPRSFAAAEGPFRGCPSHHGARGGAGAERHPESPGAVPLGSSSTRDGDRFIVNDDRY